MTKAFLLNKELSATLKMLVLIMLSQQEEETVSVEVGERVHTAPAQLEGDKNHELTRAELERILPMPEPRRCYEWYVDLLTVCRRVSHRFALGYESCSNPTLTAR